VSPSDSADRGGSPSAALIVEEVLSAVLSPRRVREVLDDALRLGGLGEIPTSPVSLRVFIEGALFSTLSRQLGIGSALDVGEQLRAALALALRDESLRPSGPPAQPGPHGHPPTAPPSEPPRVLVVSQASLVVFLLQDMLGAGIEVKSLTSETDLADALRRSAARPCVVVIDRRHPCVGPGACKVLGEHVPERSTIVWWASNAEEQRDVEQRLGAGAAHLITTAHDMDLADLGELCRGVVDLM